MVLQARRAMRPLSPLLVMVLGLCCSLCVGRRGPTAFHPSPFRHITPSKPLSVPRWAAQAAAGEPLVASVRERARPTTTEQVQASPVILVVEETDAKTELDGGWELILFNDDFNSRHHVARSLVMVCALTDDQAYEVMMQAHRFGSAVVGQYSKETAECYCEGLLASGIGCEVTKADSAE